MSNKKPIQSNLRRCPLLKITKEYPELDDQGKPTGTIIKVQEFNECYQSFCMAWKNNTCFYFADEPPVKEEEE